MKAEPLSEEGYAYFAGPAGGPIKIGFSMDPYQRLYRLQTDHPERLYLWAEAPGGRRAEDRYQARFAKHWIGGEWFARCPEIEAEIARLKAEAEV